MDRNLIPNVNNNTQLFLNKNVITHLCGARKQMYTRNKLN
jgi:hypothetical protein